MLLVSFLSPIKFASQPYAVIRYDEHIVVIAYDRMVKGHSALSQNLSKGQKSLSSESNSTQPPPPTDSMATGRRP